MRSGRILQIFVSPIVTSVCGLITPTFGANFAAICRRFYPPLVSRAPLELARPTTSCYPNRIRAGRQLARVDSDRDHSTLRRRHFLVSTLLLYRFLLFFFSLSPSISPVILFSLLAVTNFTRVTSHVFAGRTTGPWWFRSGWAIKSAVIPRFCSISTARRFRSIKSVIARSSISSHLVGRSSKLCIYRVERKCILSTTCFGELLYREEKEVCPWLNEFYIFDLMEKLICKELQNWSWPWISK